MEEVQEKESPGFYGATGRRKEAVCRVDLRPGKGKITINGRTKEEYLCRLPLINHMLEPLQVAEMQGKLDISAKVKGGGVSGQAGAIRLAIARALTLYNPDFRRALKKAGILTVDSRRVERKKYGQPKARKRFQFSKR
jgi:small subunit ribosomal protein S9